MSGVIDWVTTRSRMVAFFMVLAFIVGGASYVTLPKEGEPDIQIPIIIISLPFQGISAADSERLLVKPMEDELSDIENLKSMNSVAAESYAAVILEFEFGWDKQQVLADVRSFMKNAEAQFPQGADSYSIVEVNLSEFPIVVVSLSGNIPERTLADMADDLKSEIKILSSVLDVQIAGKREEMLAVTIDPLKLEAYDITIYELSNAIKNNNLLVPAGELKLEKGAFGIKVPSPLVDIAKVREVPIKSNGDRLVLLGDVADVELTFADRTGHARFNGNNNIALQIIKRKGFSVIDTVQDVKKAVQLEQESWSVEQQKRIDVNYLLDNSVTVGSMVKQLEGSVLTAVFLVMIVVLAALGARASLLTGFAIPATFLLTFTIMAVFGFTISNMVMFGLILSVGLLVDGAIIVVEYADQRIREGSGPMHAYAEAAKRMLWPIISSTATTLCAFLPMLFWPGIPGEFMKMLPITLFFVFGSALIVALIFLPVAGGLAGRFSLLLDKISKKLQTYRLPIRLSLFVFSVMMSLYFLRVVLQNFFVGDVNIVEALIPMILLIVFFGTNSVTLHAVQPAFLAANQKSKNITKPSLVIRVMGFIVHKPLMPLVSIGLIISFVMGVFVYFKNNNNGVEFFVESDPEFALYYIIGRGNLNLKEKDAVLRRAEDIILAEPGVVNVFATAGEGGLNSNTGGANEPSGVIAHLQIEFDAWEDRPKNREKWFSFFGLFDVMHEFSEAQFNGNVIANRLTKKLNDELPGVKVEALLSGAGPASSKPVGIRVHGDNTANLLAVTEKVSARFHEHPALIDIQDNRALPGIDWHVSVDVEKAGQYDAAVGAIGNMVQLITNGVMIDDLRVEGLTDEIEIKVRLPEKERFLSTLETLKLRTQRGLVPLSNFITIEPKNKLSTINRADRQNYYDILAGVDSDIINSETGRPYTPTDIMEEITTWIKTSDVILPGVSWKTAGDQDDQKESEAFLQNAFTLAMGLMFVILLAQFNSFYHSFLVLLAVVLSTTGALIGMMVMGQPFSIIMTGTGIVALAGIVVNNNIVLLDTYQEYARKMPARDAIVKTVSRRIRPVLMTTVTTIAGLLPMMLGLAVNFADGGMTIDSPTALWWKQLATAVIFGLGIATILTLVFTPSMLALGVWLPTYIMTIYRILIFIPRQIYKILVFSRS